MRPFKKIVTDLGVIILVAMALGSVAGYLMGPSAAIFDPPGELFIRLIKMLVVPLVFVSILSGAVSLGATRKAGKVAAWTLGFIGVTSLLAGVVAALAGAWLRPGEGIDPALVAAYRGGAQAVAQAPHVGFWDLILSLVPANPVGALTEGNILQIIFFAMLLGFGISTLQGERKTALVNMVDGALDALIWCIRVVMWTAPVGVFALMASAVGTMGFDIFAHLARLLAIDLGVVLLFGLLFYPACVALLSNVPVWLYMRSMLKPQGVAFSTASSLATLASNMQTCEQDMHLSKETCAFVLPLGATVNMTGNVIFYTLSALFFAQFYGIALPMASYVAIVASAVLSAVGQAGVPGPTFTLFAVFIAGGIPLEGIGLLFAVDRLFDMIRTVLNITGDAACAAVVDRQAA